MIDITATEEKIKTNVQETLDTTDPKFKLIVYPGELDEYGKPIQCSTVFIQYKNIDYDKQTTNSFGNCKAVEKNIINFKILVQKNNLRLHTEVYEIAMNIIENLRGKQIVTMRGDSVSTIQGCSPAYISGYSFSDVANGGACYQSEITVSAMFTDTYDRETKI